MAQYLTIPELIEAEELIAVNRGSSDHSFDIVINAGETATWLFHAAANATLVPLVVLVVGDPMIALDDVIVSSAVSGGHPVSSHMTFTLDAGGVRFV